MPRKVAIIGVPSDLGGGKSGAREGPQGLINAGLVDALKERRYEVTYTDLRAKSGRHDLFENPRPSRGKIEYRKENVGVCRLLYLETVEALRNGYTPVVIGGDHTFAIGEVGAGLEFSRQLQIPAGLAWFDGHLDAHDEHTSPSRHANGMPLRTLLGHGARSLCGAIEGNMLLPGNVLHIGAGDTDCEMEEFEFFAELNVPYYTMKHLRSGGFIPPLNALYSLRDRCDHLAVQFDLDAFDKRYCPGVAFPSEGGLSDAQGYWWADRLAETGKVKQIGIYEYNPQHEKADHTGRPNTAMVAIELILRLLHREDEKFRRTFLSTK